MAIVTNRDEPLQAINLKYLDGQYWNQEASYMEAEQEQELREYISYVKEVGKAIEAAFPTAEPPIIASIMSAALSPYYFWTEARLVEKKSDEVAALADKLIGQLRTKKMEQPVYSLLNRAVYRVTKGKDLRTIDYMAADFRATIIAALKFVNSTGSVFRNIQKFMGE